MCYIYIYNESIHMLYLLKSSTYLNIKLALPSFTNISRSSHSSMLYIYSISFQFQHEFKSYCLNLRNLIYTTELYKCIRRKGCQINANFFLQIITKKRIVRVKIELKFFLPILKKYAVKSIQAQLDKEALQSALSASIIKRFPANYSMRVFFIALLCSQFSLSLPLKSLIKVESFFSIQSVFAILDIDTKTTN